LSILEEETMTLKEAMEERINKGLSCHFLE
jgi:hypothetical protein